MVDALTKGARAGAVAPHRRAARAPPCTHSQAQRSASIRMQTPCQPLTQCWCPCMRSQTSPSRQQSEPRPPRLQLSCGACCHARHAARGRCMGRAALHRPHASARNGSDAQARTPRGTPPHPRTQTTNCCATATTPQLHQGLPRRPNAGRARGGAGRERGSQGRAGGGARRAGGAAVQGGSPPKRSTALRAKRGAPGLAVAVAAPAAWCRRQPEQRMPTRLSDPGRGAGRAQSLRSCAMPCGSCMPRHAPCHPPRAPGYSGTPGADCGRAMLECQL